MPKIKQFKFKIGKTELANIFALKDNSMCKINTTPNEKVFNKIYSLPQKLEETVTNAHKDFLTKGYSRDLGRFGWTILNQWSNQTG